MRIDDVVQFEHLSQAAAIVQHVADTHAERLFKSEISWSDEYCRLCYNIIFAECQAALELAGFNRAFRHGLEFEGAITDQMLANGWSWDVLNRLKISSFYGWAD